MFGSSCQQCNVQTPSVVIHLSLDKGTVYNGHDPMKARLLCQATFEFNRQKVVPCVHVLEWRGREQFGRRGQDVFLQAARQVVRVGKVEIFGEIYNLIQTLVTELGNFSVGQSQPHTALAPVPHGQQDGGRVGVVIRARLSLGRFQGDGFRILRQKKC